MLRLSRQAPPVGADPFLRWKMRAFFAGAALALAGLATDVAALVAAAVAVLGAGLALRFVSRWRAGRPPAGDADAPSGMDQPKRP